MSSSVQGSPAQKLITPERRREWSRHIQNLMSHIVQGRFPESEQACGHLKPPSDCPSSASLIKRKGQQPRSNLPPCHLVDGRAFCCLCWYIGYCTENLGSTRNSQPECEWNLLSFSFSPLTIQGLPNTIRRCGMGCPFRIYEVLLWYLACSLEHRP